MAGVERLDPLDLDGGETELPEPAPGPDELEPEPFELVPEPLELVALVVDELCGVVAAVVVDA